MACLLGVSACTGSVDTAAVPAPAVITAYSARMSGKWALFVDASRAAGDVAVAGMRCNRTVVALHLERAVPRAALEAFRSVSDDVQASAAPLPAATLAEGGYAGAIAVVIRDFDVKDRVDGLMDATATADVRIDATLHVTRAGGAVLEADETGTGEASLASGFVCGGATDAVANATDAAITDVVRKLAEQFADSRALRMPDPVLRAPEAQ
jgi:hypothetical protein